MGECHRFRWCIFEVTWAKNYTPKLIVSGRDKLQQSFIVMARSAVILYRVGLKRTLFNSINKSQPPYCPVLFDIIMITQHFVVSIPQFYIFLDCLRQASSELRGSDEPSSKLVKIPEWIRNSNSHGVNMGSDFVFDTFHGSVLLIDYSRRRRLLLLRASKLDGALVCSEQVYLTSRSGSSALLSPILLRSCVNV